MLPTVKPAGNLERNASFDAPACLVSNLWVFLWLRRVYWGSCKTFSFRRLPRRLSGCFNCENCWKSPTKCLFWCSYMSRLESLVFLWRRRVYGGSCKTFSFRRLPRRLLCCFAWQAWHFVTFQPLIPFPVAFRLVTLFLSACKYWYHWEHTCLPDHCDLIIVSTPRKLIFLTSLHHVLCMFWQLMIAARRCITTLVMTSRRENKIRAIPFPAQSIFHITHPMVYKWNFNECSYICLDMITLHMRVSIRVRGLHLVFFCFSMVLDQFFPFSEIGLFAWELVIGPSSRNGFRSADRMVLSRQCKTCAFLQCARLPPHSVPQTVCPQWGVLTALVKAGVWSGCSSWAASFFL